MERSKHLKMREAAALIDHKEQRRKRGFGTTSAIKKETANYYETSIIMTISTWDRELMLSNPKMSGAKYGINALCFSNVVFGLTSSGQFWGAGHGKRESVAPSLVFRQIPSRLCME